MTKQVINYSACSAVCCEFDFGGNWGMTPPRGRRAGPRAESPTRLCLALPRALSASGGADPEPSSTPRTPDTPPTHHPTHCGHSRWPRRPCGSLDRGLDGAHRPRTLHRYLGGFPVRGEAPSNLPMADAVTFPAKFRAHRRLLETLHQPARGRSPRCLDFAVSPWPRKAAQPG